MATASAADARRNRLLSGLHDAEFQALLGRLETFDAEERTVVYEPGEPIGHVYFPVSSVFSMVAGVDDSLIEVGTIGREGLVGLPAFLGVTTGNIRAFCQIPGVALRIRVAELTDFLAGADGDLHTRLNRYTQATIAQMAQSVACNQLHSVPQRAARWLLMTADRVDAATFPLTQEFLARMLGVRRATVSQVASSLQGDGVIEYVRGVMTITDRAGLEKASCPCYRIVQDEYDRLL